MGLQNARNLETQNEPGNLDEALDYLWISIKSMENPPPYLKEGARFPTKTKQVKECLRDWEENVLPSLPLRVRKACIAPVQHAERIIAKKVYEAMPATDYQHQEREDCISKAKILFITHIPAILHRSTHRRYGYVASIALSVVKDEYRVTHTPATGEDTGCRSSGNQEPRNTDIGARGTFQLMRQRWTFPLSRTKSATSIGSKRICKQH